MDLEKYIQQHYLAACQHQLDVKHDVEMLGTLAKQQYDLAVITGWMQKYGLFQGVTTADRRAVVEAFVKFAMSGPHAPRITLVEVHGQYEALYTALFGAVTRGWTSATSKLLWCLYPYDVAIYDAFVWRTLVVFQELDEEMRTTDRIGSPPWGKGTGSKQDLLSAGVTHYRHYSRLIDMLFRRHRDVLDECRQRHGIQYPYDIRILDKLLWMIGHPERRFQAPAPASR